MQLPKLILIITIPLATLLAFTSLVGILTPDFYNAETLNWLVQSVGQDIIDLFLVVPCLVITSFLAAKKHAFAWMLWGGVMFYLTYTFVIFCFDVHFNKLFLFYCIELGLSAYGTLFFLLECRKRSLNSASENNWIFKAGGIYFIIIASLFYLLWLSEIMPSILKNAIPSVLMEAGLFTNPVHVLDLSIVLPGIFITGVLILRRNKFGLMLAPAVLVFFILMDLTISYLVVLMHSRGLDSNPGIATIMVALAVISFVLLKLFQRKLLHGTTTI